MTKKTADSLWNAIPLTPKLNKTERDFFKIPVDDLIGRGLTATKTAIDLGECNHITIDLLASHGFDQDKKETTVLNFPTNSRKSTLFYDLIEQYADRDDAIVIVCSPFIKLVEKDFVEIKRRVGDQILRYDERDELYVGSDYVSIKPQVQRFKVHVMTVNCLLQNPGSSSRETSDKKQEYLSALLRYAREDGKKVFLFIDEIHESVHNFHIEFLPHLAKWRERLHKVFVASATFTVGSYVVLQHLARFTNKRISVFESPRNRELQNRASLTIHMVNEQYRDTNLEPLECLHNILESWEKKGSPGPVNILTGHRNLASQLNSKKNPQSLTTKFPTLNFKLLISGEGNTEFEPGGNHLGTLFKTGVNIEEPDNLLVIILPYTSQLPERTNKLPYGIFTDGIPSLVQALGRQRNGGECHVIMSRPAFTIEGTELRIGRGAKSFYDSTSEAYKSQLDQYRELVTDYKNKVEELGDHIKFLRGTADGVQGIGSYYPSLQDYLLERSSESIVRGSLSGGKGLSTYMLWAACNDQFEGVKLTVINYWKPKEVLIELTDKPEENWATISNHFPDLDTPAATLQDLYNAVYQKLFGENHEFRLQFLVGKKKLNPTNAAKDSRVLKTVLGSVFYQWGLDFPKLLARVRDEGFYDYYIEYLFSEHRSLRPTDNTINIFSEWRDEFTRFLLEHREVSKIAQNHLIDPKKVEKHWAQESRKLFLDLLDMLAVVDPVFKTGAVKLTSRHREKPFRLAYVVAFGPVKRDQQRSEGNSRRNGERWVLPEWIKLSHE